MGFVPFHLPLFKEFEEADLIHFSLNGGVQEMAARFTGCVGFKLGGGWESVG